MADDYEDNISYKSISCEQIPELFLDELVAKKHFSNFGTINRFILRPRLCCTVDYETEEDAANAYENAGNFNGKEFLVNYAEKEVGHVQNTEEWVDPYVRAELDAMGRNITVSGSPVSIMKPPPLPVGNTTTKADLKEIRCKPCGKSFATFFTYQQHIRIHRIKKCPFCLYETNLSSNLPIHVARHINECQFQCEICGLSFKIRQLLIRHINRQHTPNYVPPKPHAFFGFVIPLSCMLLSDWLNGFVLLSIIKKLKKYN